MKNWIRVPSSEFSAERLDINFYSKEYFDAKASIELAGYDTEPIGDLCEPWQFGAYALCNGIEWEDKETGIPFIKAEAIGSPLLSLNKLSYISKKTHFLLAKSSIGAGDIIVSTSGTVGRVAVIPEDMVTANSNQDSIKFNLSKTIYDSYYVATWFTSKYAQAFMKREAGGVVQQHIYLYNFKRLPLLKLDVRSQKYFGNKIRQAETLREWAKNLEEYVRQYHIALIPTQTTLQFDRKTRSVFAAKMTDRLDAHFYPAVVEDYLETNGVDFEILNRLCLTVFNGQTQSEITEEECEQITVTNLSSSFVKGKTRWVKKPAKNDKYLKPHDLLICNAAHNKSYIGREITYVHSEKPLLPSTEVMVIRINRDLVPASYILSYLLTKLGFVQLQSTIRGITAHSYPMDVKQLEIPIPKVPKEIMKLWFACDDLMAKAGLATEISGVLTNAAKQLVEALIENKLTEQELINAQQALERGDNTLDRQILSRLTTKGIDDEDGAPLFTDLDQLYDLLNQAENFQEVTP